MSYAASGSSPAGGRRIFAGSLWTKAWIASANNASPAPGLGYLLGIELVTSRVTKAPANAAAEAVMYRALEKGLSFKTTFGNVLTLIVRPQSTAILNHFYPPSSRFAGEAKQLGSNNADSSDECQSGCLLEFCTRIHNHS